MEHFDGILNWREISLNLFSRSRNWNGSWPTRTEKVPYHRSKTLRETFLVINKLWQYFKRKPRGNFSKIFWVIPHSVQEHVVCINGFCTVFNTERISLTCRFNAARYSSISMAFFSSYSFPPASMRAFFTSSLSRSSTSFFSFALLHVTVRKWERKCGDS